MAITPQPGYQIDPNNANGVVPINAPQPPTPPTPSVVINNNPTNTTTPTPPTNNPNPPLPSGAEAPAPQTPSTDATTPTKNLQQGAEGQDVQQLQNYLVQHGYLTSDQVATGPGIYGPQTTAAVAKLQQDLGVQAGTGSGAFGPKTQSALSQKYNSFFDSKKDTPSPDTNPRTDIQNATQNSTDPVFGALSSSFAPIMQSLSQVLQNINNPALSAVSLQQEYNDLAQKNNLPGMQSELLNMQRVMTGTESDIRDEITKSGGSATESQVLGLTAARNKVIMKQYSTLASQYQAAQTNVQNMMQYASQDQQTNMQREQMTASITTSMASVESQMMQMGMTMQNNARSAIQYNVTQMGYKGLAQSAQGNPNVLNYYENILGLAPGTLGNPASLAAMDTYKDQQLQINNYKAAISAFTAGYGGGVTNNYYGDVPSSTHPVDASTLVRPPWLKPDVPLTLSAPQMEQYMNANKAATTDPGTHNIVAPGIGYYLQQPDGSYALKAALPSPITQQYNDIRQTIDSAGVFNGSPTVTRKWTLSANTAASAFKDTGTYKVISNVAPYLAAIHAAAVNPGDKSISDFELLDSFVKAAKGGVGQVTDSQINVMLNGASIPDKYNIMQQKLQNGGVLAPAQRTALATLADETYKRNVEDYQKIYVQATQAMQAEGIPAQFWRNLPDFQSLMPQ